MKKTKFYLFVCCTLLIIGCDKDPNDPIYETFVDSRDQHVYKYVKIGTQTWMAENLAYLPAVGPSSDGSESSALYYVYDYEGSSISEAKSKGNYTSYGVLYNLEAAKISCPSGWHLPSDAEWKILEDYLGALAGKKMKSITEWSENGNGDNSSGFNALPGGFRLYSGVFGGLGDGTGFWSSSEVGSSGWARSLSNTYGDVRGGWGSPSHGYSVRCLQN